MTTSVVLEGSGITYCVIPAACGRMLERHAAEGTVSLKGVVAESNGQFVPLIFGRKVLPPETDDQRGPRRRHPEHGMTLTSVVLVPLVALMTRSGSCPLTVLRRA